MAAIRNSNDLALNFLLLAKKSSLKLLLFEAYTLTKFP